MCFIRIRITKAPPVHHTNSIWSNLNIFVVPQQRIEATAFLLIEAHPLWYIRAKTIAFKASNLSILRSIAPFFSFLRRLKTNKKIVKTIDIRPNQLIDETLYSGWNRRHHERKKKRRSTVDHRKTTCMLYLQADHLFYGKMGSEEACIETMTRHVQRVNSIYKNVGKCSATLDSRARDRA